RPWPPARGRSSAAARPRRLGASPVLRYGGPVPRRDCPRRDCAAPELRRAGSGVRSGGVTRGLRHAGSARERSRAVTVS
ncbi:hypothetical protein NGM37_03440, partial [Streptomyces sp. TRM76130]|nr:hypothetical protein [Streptomyces sp. TRM76130]